MSDPAHCCIHLPGNRQCPHGSVYVVEWVDASGTTTGPRRVYRTVCPFHLESGVRDAMTYARDVRVRMAET